MHQGAEVLNAARERASQSNKLTKLIGALSSPQEAFSRQGRGEAVAFEPLSPWRPHRSIWRHGKEVGSHVMPKHPGRLGHIPQRHPNTTPKPQLVASEVIAQVRQPTCQTFLAFVVDRRTDLCTLATAINRPGIGAVREASEMAFQGSGSDALATSAKPVIGLRLSQEAGKHRRGWLFAIEGCM
jgi:hypothetical protein